MTAPLNRQFVLAQRPQGAIDQDTFRYQETPLGEPGPGQVLVRNLYLSLDPAMRGWLNDAKSYIPPVGIGEVMRALGYRTRYAPSVAAMAPDAPIIGTVESGSVTTCVSAATTPPAR